MPAQHMYANPNHHSAAGSRLRLHSHCGAHVQSPQSHSSAQATRAEIPTRLVCAANRIFLYYNTELTGHKGGCALCFVWRRCELSIAAFGCAYKTQASDPCSLDFVSYCMCPNQRLVHLTCDLRQGHEEDGHLSWRPSPCTQWTALCAKTCRDKG
eukprot:681870-Pelagomonas_calceolata.AAC.2